MTEVFFLSPTKKKSLVWVMFVQNRIDRFASTIAFKMTLMTILLRNEYLFKEKMYF